jgi:hypothetical protein
MTTPPRPDQESVPPPMVIAAGGSAGVFRGRLIIVNGSAAPPGSGIFIYNSTGALIGAWVGSAGTDPLDGGAVAEGLTVQDATGTKQTLIDTGSITVTKVSGAFTPPLITVNDQTLNSGDTPTLAESVGLVALNVSTYDPVKLDGTGETWHDLATPSNGWTIGGHAAYTLLPDGWLGIAFKDLVPGTDTDGTTVFSSANGLPAAYRPANSHRIVAYTNTLRVSGASFEMGALEFETDGSIQCFGIAAAATRLDLFTAIPLNDS